MKKCTAVILILLIATQTFGNWAITIAFKINQSYIAKNFCENRFRPQMHCNGNCVLMKKLRAAEKEEQNAPGNLKSEVAAAIISSKFFFPQFHSLHISLPTQEFPVVSAAKTVDRSLDFFHPPCC